MKKTIEVDVEYGISIFDLIYELQDIADKFGDLIVWSCQDLAFKTRDKNEGEKNDLGRIKRRS